MKLLITGASGQLGSSLRYYIKHHFNNIDCLTPDRNELDVSNFLSVKNYFAGNNVDAVVHAAAYTAVDLAEMHSDECLAVNAKGTGFIIDVCKENNIFCIYISTDYVFDGRKKDAYFPTDDPNPISLYGKSKLLGEKYTLKYSNSLIIRTSWLFGKNGHNFVNAITKNAKKSSLIKVVSDQEGCPTYADDLSKLIVECLFKRPHGIIHATNVGKCTRSDFARKIIELQNLDCSVQDVLSNEYISAAARPHNSVLDTSCLDDLGIMRLPSWEDALNRYLLD